MHSVLLSVLLVVAAQLLLSVAEDDDRGSRCKFTLNKLQFDLCPLFAKPLSISWEESTPPTFTTHRYAMSFGVPLKRDSTLPIELQCPNGHDSEPTRIIQVVPIAEVQGLNPKAILLPKTRANDTHQPLQVTLHGGTYNHRSQKASFRFACDHSAEEPTQPKFFWQFNSTHTFLWRTKFACARSLPPGAPGQKPEKPDADPPATLPSDPDADKDDGEQLTRPRSLSPLVILFCLVLSAVGLRLIYPWLSRWIRNATLRWRYASANRNRNFKPSVVNLVRWASEEDPEEYGAEGSFMQSSRDGEQTPLSPTFQTSVKGQYGTAG
ncbi:autophagy-related protein 27 [Favolaschia claudopus]|uniref:Autophagy-related protein 27 n=1 Tax=Favolaschia claudopus TaxID=2862362 RepID=A0AAW0DTE0_9AGAR